MVGQHTETKYPDARGQTFEDGLRYEQFVSGKIKFLFGKDLHFFKGKTQQLRGENKEGVEIKFDGKLKDTGNVYIETAEKSRAGNANYYPSGIFRKDNSRWFWIGDYRQAFIFNKAVLQVALNREGFKKTETNTSQGVLMSIEKAKTICKRHLVFGGNNV